VQHVHASPRLFSDVLSCELSSSRLKNLTTNFQREAFGPPAFYFSERKFLMDIRQLLITTKFRDERMPRPYNT
jgi:hypothetical protein